MAKGAKKKTKRMQAARRAASSRRDARSSRGGDVVAVVRADADPPPPPGTDQHRLLVFLVDSAGRVFRAVTGWLTSPQKHVRVLAWITWLFFLGSAGLVLMVMLFRWHPAQTLIFFVASTGLIAGVNLFNRFFRKR
jgi:hypothetical protein